MTINGHGLGATVDLGVAGAIKRAKSGSNLSKRFKAVELRSYLAELKKFIAKGGKSDVEMMDALNRLRVGTEPDGEDCSACADADAGICSEHKPKPIKARITPAIYNELKRELFRQGQAELNGRTAEETFLEYSWAQQQNIQDLDQLIIDAGQQANAKLGAIRAKSEIQDKILKTGQDMGIIAREPERKLILHGHVVADMSDVQLRKLIATELGVFARVVERFGNTNMDGELIDADSVLALPAPQFSDDAKPKIAMGGAVKAAAARKSRRVKRSKVIDATGISG